MSAMLRAAGDNFDVEMYLGGCTLPDVSSYKRGDRKFPKSQPSGPRLQQSGIHAVASAADFDDFSQQVADSIKFLITYADEVRRLRNFPGVEGVTLDFGISRRDVVVQFVHFPAELVRLAGSLDLGLELSVYPCDTKPMN